MSLNDDDDDLLMTDRQANYLMNALLVMVLTPHIRTYLQMTDPKALEQAEFGLKDVGAEMKTVELADEDLESIMAAGASARKVLATRVNARLDARERELNEEIALQRHAIGIVQEHKEKQHPVVQKYVDRILDRMEAQIRTLGHERDMLRYQRMSEELFGQPMA